LPGASLWILVPVVASLFLLDSDQFLLCGSFDFLSFLIPVLHMDLMGFRAVVNDLSGEGALVGDWCGASPLVWVELTAPPFWMEHVGVDILAGYSWTCGMVPEVGYSVPSVMVGRS
jgi:hypothetical protein